ncbi:MerR family transcriptional regulator [Acrocarpospora phusangensis]|uniref:MerR family transcriptional regulator n=1 Tax=Acrocarpospora phusangensis TaxID=1070424 RepID=A0A919QDD6_9ACTN|nr:MerR family transcriptional regulator [Acrocarpospora phusangensis]GIH24207.1 MerR family transcriptional regulator [Acrocarpospora phusangensis]
MSERTELFTIGQLARSTGLPVRTIRFWSDQGVLPETRRSTGGYRLYDVAAVARLELVRTLRELGLDLDTVCRVVRRPESVAEIAGAHADALDAEIRALRLKRAVLRSIARRGSDAEEMRLMHRMARLSARERQNLIDDFVDHTFAGLDPAAPGAGIADAMRRMPAELPDEPTDEQVDAWVELAELVADEAFRRRVREMAEAGARGGDAGPALDSDAILRHAGAAADSGVDPASPEGQAVVDLVVGTERAGRGVLADQLATFTDARVERYWLLMGVLNGLPPFTPAVAAYEWLIAALRASPELG